MSDNLYHQIVFEVGTIVFQTDADMLRASHLVSALAWHLLMCRSFSLHMYITMLFFLRWVSCPVLKLHQITGALFLAHTMPWDSIRPSMMEYSCSGQPRAWFMHIHMIKLDMPSFRYWSASCPLDIIFLSWIESAIIMTQIYLGPCSMKHWLFCCMTLLGAFFGHKTSYGQIIFQQLTKGSTFIKLYNFVFCHIWELWFGS